MAGKGAVSPGSGFSAGGECPDAGRRAGTVNIDTAGMPLAIIRDPARPICPRSYQDPVTSLVEGMARIRQARASRAVLSSTGERPGFRMKTPFDFFIRYTCGPSGPLWVFNWNSRAISGDDLHPLSQPPLSPAEIRERFVRVLRG